MPRFVTSAAGSPVQGGAGATVRRHGSAEVVGVEAASRVGRATPVGVHAAALDLPAVHDPAPGDAVVFDRIHCFLLSPNSVGVVRLWEPRVQFL